MCSRNKIFPKHIQQWVEKIIYYDQMKFILIIQDLFNTNKSVDTIHHINRLKEEIYMIISMVAKKGCLIKFDIH